jgi:hypothetical protein
VILLPTVHCSRDTGRRTGCLVTVILAVLGSEQHQLGYAQGTPAISSLRSD